MKVLIVGGGGREHAIAIMVSRSAEEPRVYAVASHRNPGLRRLCESTGGVLAVVRSITKPKAVTRVAEEVSPDLVVIGPEEPLFAGVADALRSRGFTVFGAGSRLAEIEKDKVFARELMWRYGIPGRLFYRAFTELEEALRFMEMAGDVVVKPARQAGGKGVKVFADLEAYLADERSEAKRLYVEKMYRELASKLRDVRRKLLVEQRVEGVEYTVTLVTDGSYSVALPAVQDHPHAYELDLGPETGGMGSIAGPGYTPPFLTREEYRRSIEIVERSLEALQKEVGERYVGALSGQMMLTAVWGPTLIEFYARFGDPEIANLIPVIESDFLELLDRAATGRLAGARLRIRDDLATVVKAVAPAGYPLDRKAAKGHPVAVDEEGIEELGCTLLYAAVEELGGAIYTTGSRAFEVVCSAPSIEEAGRLAERAVGMIRSLDGWPLIHRSDIGSRELLMRRIEVAERIRAVYRYREARGLLGTSIVWVPGKGIFSDPLTRPFQVPKGG